MRILTEKSIYRIRERLGELYGEDNAPRLAQRFSVLADRYARALRARYQPDKPLWDEQDVLLITYGDMVHTAGEPPLLTLRRFLAQRLKDCVRIVHILPFFPYSSDEGFSVIDYRQVDPALGTWHDIQTIGQDFDLMFDLVLNHASSQSEWFRHFSNGIAPYRDYFIVVEPDTDLGSVVRPRTSPLLTPTQTPSGERHVWTTFSADQVDLNFHSDDVLFEFLDILLLYIQNGARIIRLDAIAYLWKEIGTSCINLPQTHEVVKLLRDVLDVLAPDVLLLTETNLPHEQNISYFGQGDEARMVYQFSLPPLLLHALYAGTTRYLSAWAAALADPPPGCCFLNFTASHDGIGVRPLEGLVPENEVERMVHGVRQRGGHVSSYTAADGREVPYELNITWYAALSDPDHPDSDEHIARFLCSQAVMLALKGIPAVYFHSLTACPNDEAGVKRSGHPRSINRKRWNAGELNALLDNPNTPTARVFAEYGRLLRLRARHPAFHPDGPQRVLELPDGVFAIERVSPDGSERILCLSNLTAVEQAIEAAGLDGEPADVGWHDLITGESIAADADGGFRLRPYQTLWLTTPVAL
ncbi:MAG TPA: alpha-amylase [Gammaproteobacteria bacterium]|nr:alpha-amylase [Gammaproteobacteria bacterium]